jgi:hypothetical protein
MTLTALTGLALHAEVPRLFITEKPVYRTWLGTSQVTREIVKRCPTLMVVSTDRRRADYVLVIESGASNLINSDGEIVAVLEGHFPGTLAKDVCKYFGAGK